MGNIGLLPMTRDLLLQFISRSRSKELDFQFDLYKIKINLKSILPDLS